MSKARAGVEDIYRLTPLQQGMLYHELAEPECGMYLIHRGYELRGPLRAEAFIEVWQRAALRHPPLRTSFHWKEVEAPVQVVHRDPELQWEMKDWARLSPADLSQQMNALEAHQKRPFDFERAPLMRLALVRLGEQLHHFAWTFHHLLLEGWSTAIVLDEVLRDYEAATRGKELTHAVAPLFRDYVTWLDRQDAGSAERYWKETLAGVQAPATVLPTPNEDQPTSGWRNEVVTRSLSEEATAALESLARSEGITLNTILLGAWVLLLSRYSGEGDVVVGTTVSGRSGDLEGMERIVGLLVNTLPLRARVDPDQDLVTWLRELQSSQVGARDYEWTSLLDIHGWSQVPRTTPLFETIVVFSNWAGSETMSWEGSLEVECVRSVEGGTGYPLTLMIAPGDRLELSLAFDGRRHDQTAIQPIVDHLYAMLEDISADARGPAGLISFLSEEDRERLLGRNATGSSYPRDRCLHELFEEQAASAPNRTAAVFGAERLSYGDLDRQANRLARYLQDRGVARGELVGLCVDRSLEMLVALIAVLKAGGAYVPIDPSFPVGRQALMLEDAGVRVLVTKGSLGASVPSEGLTVVRVDEDSQAIGECLDGPIEQASTPADLAYVMYTSGSTGRPKGVEIEHRSFVNFLSAMRERPGFEANDTLLAVTTISFDISGLELFLPLVTGGTVAIADETVVADGRSLAEEVVRTGTTVMQATPATWRLLFDSGWTGARHLKVLCGGEALPRELANRLSDSCGSVWNLYGPTETTIWSTVARIESGNGFVSIGAPIANTRLYVLDDRMGLVPDGVKGQLFIGGDGVARGYHDRPDLTAERFVEDPFSNDAADRMYATGDLVRFTAEGDLECLGRIDHQVKVRGFRIEPGEIEKALQEHEAVRQAAVVAREFGPGDVRLVAYVRLGSTGEATPSELRSFLRERLPGYMVPRIFSYLEELPLTPNGKVDRNALPPPDEFHIRSGAGSPPSTPMEKLVAEIWSELLGLDSVGVGDGFFDLGGHSLLAMRASVEIEKKTGRRINPLKMAILTLGQLAYECEPGVESTAS